MRINLLLALLPFLLWLPMSAAADNAGPIEIGSRLELFVDGHLIDSMKDVQLKLHSPCSAGKILILDKPWEGVTCDYHIVFKDDDRYRMYYRGSSHEGYVIPSLLRPGETPVPDHPHVTAYAESPDGISWTRPSVGLFEFNGSKDNNIVWMGDGVHNFCPFKDGNPDALRPQKYKAVGRLEHSKKPSLVGFVSPDGIHWKRLRTEPLLTDGKFDSLNVAFWDSVRRQYVAFYRDFHDGIRSFKFATSKDFLNWSPGQFCDFGDAPVEQFYTNGTVAYFRAPHIFIALPRRMQLGRKLQKDAPWSGLSDTVFMSSRDGLNWDRRFLQAFIRPGRDPRSWTSRTNSPAWGVVPTADDEISLYVMRNRDMPSCCIERMVLRTDGFVSIHADGTQGECITKALVFEGEKLVLNYATSAVGSIRVEVQDAHGEVIRGFGLQDCPPIFGDRLQHVVSWKRRSDLSMLAGKPIRLRFVNRDADLYSLRFK